MDIVVISVILLLGIIMLIFVCKRKEKYQAYQLINRSYNLNNKIDDDRLKDTIKIQRIYNPSIVKLGRDMLIVSKLVYWSFFSQKGIVHHQISFYFSKISNCDINNSNGLIISNIITANDNATHSGGNDPRIFIYDNEVYLLCVMASLKLMHAEWSMYLCKMTPDLLSVANFLRIKPSKDLGKTQKNWNPFIVKNGKQLCVSHIQPHTIVELNMETGDAMSVYKTESMILRKIYPNNMDLRGSSRYVETPIGYLAICHHIKQRQYTHLFYLVEKIVPYRIINFSEPFCIPNPTCNKIQFVSGLERVGDTLWIAYGDDDKSANIAIIDLDYVLYLVQKNSAL